MPSPSLLIGWLAGFTCAALVSCGPGSSAPTPPSSLLLYVRGRRNLALPSSNARCETFYTPLPSNTDEQIEHFDIGIESNGWRLGLNITPYSSPGQYVMHSDRPPYPSQVGGITFGSTAMYPTSESEFYMTGADSASGIVTIDNDQHGGSIDASLDQTTALTMTPAPGHGRIHISGRFHCSHLDLAASPSPPGTLEVGRPPGPGP